MAIRFAHVTGSGSNGETQPLAYFSGYDWSRAPVRLVRGSPATLSPDNLELLMLLRRFAHPVAGALVELAGNRVGPLWIERTPMSMQQIAQHQRLLSGGRERPVETWCRPHPAVLAHMPGRGRMRIFGVIKKRDP